MKGISAIAYSIEAEIASCIDSPGKKTAPSITGARLLIKVANGLSMMQIIKTDAIAEDGKICIRCFTIVRQITRAVRLGIENLSNLGMIGRSMKTPVGNNMRAPRNDQMSARSGVVFLNRPIMINGQIKSIA